MTEDEIREAQKYRCPDMRPDLWDKICEGPERTMVELTFNTGEKVEAWFYDGWCGERYKFENVVDVRVLKADGSPWLGT